MYEDISFPEYYDGEVECRYEYQGEFTDWFGWLYIDQHTMKSVAEEEGWISEIVFRGRPKSIFSGTLFERISLINY